VPRTKDLSLVKRDIAIQLRIAKGDRMADIAQDYGLTISRVSQIHHAQRDLVADDEKREILAAKLEHALDEKLLALLNEDRKVKVTPSGRPVYEMDESGRPDYTRPVLDDTAIIETTKAVVGVVHELASLYGLHRKVQKTADESASIAEWEAYITQIAEDNKRLRERLELAEGTVVEAEVVEQLLPGD
jgi:transcriptional regulator with XRE-family HTH domain